MRDSTDDEALLATPMNEALLNAKHGSSWLRWYCLLIVSGVSGLQGGYWANFGPISEAVEPYFGWEDSDIALLANWGPIMYLLAAVPTAWLLDIAGLRVSCIVAALLTLAGSVLRCIHVHPGSEGSLLMHGGQILNAIAGPVAMSAGPVLSAVWFPPSERTFATAVVATTNYGGSAAMFALGPLLVPAGKSSDETGANLLAYMQYEALVAAALFAGALAFPRAPKTLPSRSAGLPRVAARQGLASLRRVRPFWMLALSYGVSAGVFAAWGSMLGPNMKAVLPADKAETQGGWMGFGGAIAGIFGGILLSAYADRASARQGRKKWLLMALEATAVACALAFAVLCGLPEPSRHTAAPSNSSSTTSDEAQVSTWRLTLLYVTSIGVALCVNAAAPLFYEAAVEAAFPIAEGLVTTVLTVSMNIAVLVFLLVPCVPHGGTQWMNWTLALACALALLIVCPLSEPRKRLQVDEVVDQSA